MSIDDLLNKYFEGETSFEEEQRLRAFFASDKVPKRLAIYKPMFTYFDEEIRKRQLPAQKILSRKRKVIYYVSGIAATLLLLLSVRYLFYTQDLCLCSGNYVMINGRCYTDMEKVRALAFEALQEVATPTNEYFPDKEMGIMDREIIENQLKELKHIFSDDE